jgi:flagellar assembly factor FliW
MTTMMERTRQLHFVEPLPGFAGEDEYTLEPIDPRGLLFSLRAVNEPSLRFVLTPADAFFDDYHPDVAGAVAPVLGGEDISLLLVLTLGAGLADATANLRAPVVYAPASGRAVQVILDDEALPMRTPLLPAA